MSEKEYFPNSSLFSGDPVDYFSAMIAVLVTLLAAVTNFLRVAASAEANQAARDAQIYAMQAVAVKTAGEIQTSYAYTDHSAFWHELDSLAYYALLLEDEEARARYLELRDSLTKLNPLFKNPYFDLDTWDDGKGLFPDIGAYMADTYVVETRILEQHAKNALEVKAGWSDKFNAYVTQMILISLALFFLGISKIIAGRLRWLFVTLGSIFGLVTLLWMVIVYLRPINDIPDEAIEAFADGVGLIYRWDYAGALEKYSEALEIAPNYAAAYEVRGDIYYQLGDQESAELDYLDALTSGSNDLYRFNDLGWIYYLQGRLDEAVDVYQKSLELDDQNLMFRFNLALAYLAGDQIEEAQTEYETGIEIAHLQVRDALSIGEHPSVRLWWLLWMGSDDLRLLQQCIHSEYCEESAPIEVLEYGEDIADVAKQIERRLKNVAVALEYTGQLPGDASAALIGPFVFSAALYEENDRFVGPESGNIFTGEFTEVRVAYEYEGMRDGQLIVAKFFADGEESTALRVVEEWSGGEVGEAELSFGSDSTRYMYPGDYQIELYVDAHLVQVGEFTIEE